MNYAVIVRYAVIVFVVVAVGIIAVAIYQAASASRDAAAASRDAAAASRDAAIASRDAAIASRDAANTSRVPATASRVAENCRDVQSECSFLETLQPILRSTKTMQAFRFSQPCTKCNERVLNLGEFTSLPKVSLDSEVTTFFLNKLAEPSSYVLGLQKAMPFFADYGFVLEGSDSPVVLLLSTYSQSIRLVRDGSERVLIGNIDPIFPQVRAQLDSIFAANQPR